MSDECYCEKCLKKQRVSDKTLEGWYKIFQFGMSDTPRTDAFIIKKSSHSSCTR